VIAPARTPPHLLTMILLVGLVVLTLNMFLPALPAMAVAFGVGEGTMGLAVSAYMVAAGVLQLILGPISDLLGRRPVILGAMAVYALASLGAVLAIDFTVFLVCRLMQALVLAGSIVGLAALRDMYATREAAGKMGTIAAAMAIAPMIGPALGGVLDTLIGWRAIFALYTGLGAACAVLCWADWGETRAGEAHPARAVGGLPRAAGGGAVLGLRDVHGDVGRHVLHLPDGRALRGAGDVRAVDDVDRGGPWVHHRGLHDRLGDHGAACRPGWAWRPSTCGAQPCACSACASGRRCSFRACRIP
jgi:MFS family permease